MENILLSYCYCIRINCCTGMFDIYLKHNMNCFMELNIIQHKDGITEVCQFCLFVMERSTSQAINIRAQTLSNNNVFMINVA